MSFFTHFSGSLNRLLFSLWGGALGGSVKDTGNHGGNRRRHHKADRRIKRGKRGNPYHAVTAPGRGAALKAGPRQHGTAGTEAPAPYGCGAGDEGKAGNLKSRCGTGK